MKRFIPVLCVALALVCAFSVPVQAAEISNDNFFDVLHYSSPDDSGSLVKSIKSGDTLSFAIPRSTYYWVDMVIRSNIPNLTVTVNSKACTITVIDDKNGYLYRIFGNLNGAVADSLNFKFTFASGSIVTFESINVSTLKVKHFEANAHCEIDSPNFTGSFDYTAGGQMAYQILSPITSPEDNFFTAYINSPDWQKYDFLDFYFLFDCSSVSSISASMGSINVPIDVSPFQDSSFSSQWFVHMRMDLRGLDRNSEDHPMIIVAGTGRLDNPWSIACMSASGYVLSDVADSDSFNLIRIFDTLKSGFFDILKAFSDFKDTWLKTLATHFQNINNNIGNMDNHLIQFANKSKEWIEAQTAALSLKFDELKTSFGQIGNIEQWIKDQTKALSTKFDILSQDIQGYFSNMNNVISEQTNTLSQKINQLQNQLIFTIDSLSSKIDLHFTDLNKWISDQTITIDNAIARFQLQMDGHFTDLKSHITSMAKNISEVVQTQTDNIKLAFTSLENNIKMRFSELQQWIDNQTDALIVAIKGDAHAADDLKGDVDEKKDQIGDMITVMDSVDRPDVGNINLDAGAGIDQQMLLVSMSGLSSAMQNPIIMQILTMSLILATAGYALFGKR